MQTPAQQKQQSFESNQGKTDSYLALDGQAFSHGNVIFLKRKAGNNLPIIYISANIQTELGYDAEELIDKQQSYTQLIHIEDLLMLEQYLVDVRSGKQDHLDLEYRLRNKQGQYLWFREVSSIIRDAEGKIIQYDGYILNVTNEKQAFNEIKKLAHYDNLTGLPNRVFILSKLKQEIDRAKDNQFYGALLYIGLDRLKKVNDNYSHATGDKILKITAERLRQAMRKRDTVARMDGDEFICIIAPLGSNKDEVAEYTHKVAERIRISINSPYNIETNKIKLSASFGLCLYNGNNHTPEDILKFADMAMTNAKSNGQNNIRFFDKKIHQLASHRSSLENALLIALQENQFQLFFQPIVNRERNIIAFESLIRWQHPEKGFISPAEFIPVAENTGMIQKISEYVVDSAFKQLAEWEKNNFFSEGRIKYLSINISPNQFWHVDFMSNIQAKLEEYEIDPAHLLIEITENIFIVDLQDAIDKLNQIKKLGFKIALDDFGCGYSSLSYLMQLPLDTIKMDRSFIQEIHKNDVKSKIVESVCNIAQELRLNIIAEGVETVDELQTLVSFNCDAYQGYYFYKPMPIEDLSRILQKRTKTGFNDFNNTVEIPINLDLTSEIPMAKLNL